MLIERYSKIRYTIKRLLSNYVLSRVKQNQTPNPALVLERVKTLFVNHGVELTQIPRIFPKITLEDLSNDDLLIKKLSPQLIIELANLFAVNPAWLEGVSNQIYQSISCYKAPANFFQHISQLQIQPFSFPFRIIKSDAMHFDFQSKVSQPFMIVFADKISEINDKSIYRYSIDSYWDWQDETSRVQIKAMSRVYWRQYHQPISIYSVSPKLLALMQEGVLFPYALMTGSHMTSPSLEDYAMYSSESVVSKESEELPLVETYINQFEFSNLVDVQQDNKQVGQTLQQKAAFARHQPINELKRACVKFWLETDKKFSQKDTARRFYKSLPIEDKKLLAESNAEVTLANAISEFKNQDKLKSENKLPNWLKDFQP